MSRKAMAVPFCDGCFYYAKMAGGDMRYCSYYFRTNERRPCPPGEGCTVKVPRKIYRRKKKNAD